MCKTIKNCYYKKLTFSKLLEAHERARVGKTNKPELMKFEMDLETQIMNVYVQLKRGTYYMGKYREFKTYEPKERIIKSLPYIDRVVHQWYVQEFIKPYIIPRFIQDTYACVEGRGTHGAVYKTQKYMRIMKRKYSSYYILKCDIKKFFYTIDKDILFQIMSNYIQDKKLLELTKIFIYSDGDKLGIPIGNYTSQFFANIYLNELDHYIKEELQVKYYIRYMDDFILFVKNKEDAKNLLEKIEQYITVKLHLKLNEKTRYYPSKMGVNFCGYVIYETHIKLRKRSIKKIKKKVKLWNHQFQKGEFSYSQFLLEYNSFLGRAKHANTYYFLNKINRELLCLREK